VVEERSDEHHRTDVPRGSDPGGRPNQAGTRYGVRISVCRFSGDVASLNHRLPKLQWLRH